MKNLSFLFFAIISLNLSAQFANKWEVGNGFGINFNTPTPSIISGAIPSNHADNSSSISDVSGNLLFYTNGINVWDRTHAVMPNGSGLIGNLSAGQCALIIPIPCSSSKYVIFHCTYYSNPGNLSYSVVDMNLNSGFGDVVAGQKNVSLGTGWTEKLCAYYNPSGNFYWLLTHKWNSDQFVAFKIDVANIAVTSVTSSIGTIHNSGTFGGVHDAMGQLTISPDGTKVLNALTSQDKYDLFDFNIVNGVLSNSIAIPGNSGNAWGTAFSPDSKKIYTNGLYFGDIYQYDISTYTPSAIIASKYQVYSTGVGSYNFGYMELGPDGKVYIPRPNTFFISVINAPNQIGSACSYSFSGLSTGTKQAQWGTSRIAYNIPIPAQPFTISSSVSNITCFGMANGSATVSTTMSGTYTYSWSPGSYSTSIVNNLNPGIYSVSVSDGLCTTVSTLIAVSQPQPVSINITPSQLICNGNSAILNSTVSGGTPAYSYSWSNGSVFSGTSVSPGVQTTYTLSISDANGCMNQAVTTVSVADCTGIQENQNAVSVAVYPNPFCDKLEIKTNTGFDEYVITNVLGSIVRRSKQFSDLIDTKDLQQGVYFIRLFEKGKTIGFQKIIKSE
jgi:hypothetical protein